MSELAHRLCQRFYGNAPHPYRIFEDEVRVALPSSGFLLDAGCGRTAPVLQKFRGLAGRMVGIDRVQFVSNATDVELYEADLESIPVESGTVDVVMSRSVFEHLEHPEPVYAEIFRVLKPGGRLVFLTANIWDYATMIARIVPNHLHPKIVAKTEGRAEEDVFPTCYRTNSRSAVCKLADSSGFAIESFRYLGQYPNYFLFNAPLFVLGTMYDKVVSRFTALEILRGWILVTLVK